MDESVQNDEQRLWVRFVSGDPLTASEGERLTRWVDDADLKDVFLKDLETDRSLRALGALPTSEEQFIEGTLARLEIELAERHTVRLQPVPAQRGGWRLAGPVLAAAAAAFLIGLGLGLFRTPDPIVVDNGSFVSAVSDTNDDGVPILPARLGAGTVELPTGNATLAFDNGATLDVEGPAKLELVDEDEVLFLHGRAQADVPAKLATFVVTTPTTRVRESGVAYEIVVQEELHGETEVRLISGELSVEPGRRGQWTGRDRRLTTDSLRKAHVTLLSPHVAEAPLVIEAEGELGDYSGAFVRDGRWVEFGEPRAMHHAVSRFHELLVEKPEGLHEFWSELAPVGEPTVLLFEDGTKHVFTIDRLHELGKEMSVLVRTEVHGDVDGDGTDQRAEVDVEINGLRLRLDGKAGFLHGLSSTGEGAQVLWKGNWVDSDDHRVFRSVDELKGLIELRTLPLRKLGLDTWTEAGKNERFPGKDFFFHVETDEHDHDH